MTANILKLTYFALDHNLASYFVHGVVPGMHLKL